MIKAAAILSRSLPTPISRYDVARAETSLAALKIVSSGFPFDDGYRMAPAGRVQVYFMLSAMVNAPSRFTQAEIRNACAMVISRMVCRPRQTSTAYVNPAMIVNTTGKIHYANIGGTTGAGSLDDSGTAPGGFTGDSGVTWQYRGLQVPTQWATSTFIVDIDGDFFTALGPDSNDSYAAVLMSACVAGGVDSAWLGAASGHPGRTRLQILGELAASCITGGIANNLSPTFIGNKKFDGSDYTFQFLADNCEAWRGLVALASLYTTAGDGASATTATNNAATLRTGILALKSGSRFATSFGGATTGTGNAWFVSDGRFHLWPRFCGVVTSVADVNTYFTQVASYVKSNTPGLYTDTAINSLAMSEAYAILARAGDKRAKNILGRRILSRTPPNITVCDLAMFIDVWK